MAIIPFGDNYYEGLTADIKPTNIPAGSIYRDTQLDIIYEYNGSSWDIIIGNTKSEIFNNKIIDFSTNTVQHLGESEYSVYFDNSATPKYIAKDNRTGAQIATGTTLDAVLPTVLSTINALTYFGSPNPRGGTVRVSAGTHILSGGFSGFDIPEMCTVEMSSNCIISVPQGYTGYAFRMNGYATGQSSASVRYWLKGGYIKEAGTPQHLWDGLLMQCNNPDTSAALYGCVVEDTTFVNALNGVHLKTTDATGLSYINGCIFRNLIFNNCVNMVNFDQNGMPLYTGGIGFTHRNEFYSLVGQSGTDSAVGFKNITGLENAFFGCKVWDISGGGITSNIVAAAKGTQIYGGIMTSQNFTDLGVDTWRLDDINGFYPSSLRGSIKLDPTSGTYVEYIKPKTNSAQELLAKWRLDEDTTSYATIENFTSINATFAPNIVLRQASSATFAGGRYTGMIQTGFDSGSVAALILEGKTNAGALATRPIVSIYNFTTEEYQFGATNADFKSNNLINTVITEATNTLTLRQAYTYLIYPSGATDFKVKRGSDNAVVYTSSNGGTANAKGALDFCTTALGNTSPGGIIQLSEGYFPVTSSFTLNGASHRYIKIKGVGDGSNFGPLTEIRATGNFAAITIDGQTGSALGFGLEGIHLSHDQATFGTGLIRAIDTVVECQFKDLSFFDTSRKVGDCFKFEILNTGAVASQYANKIINCNSRGFDNFIGVNNQAVTASFGAFMSTLDVQNCTVWNSKRVLNVAGVAGAQVLDWNFDRVNWQYDATNAVSANEGVFNYDSVVSCWQHKHTNCMIWDITTPGINYANVGTSVELALNECTPTFRIGGSGAYLNKVKVNEYYLGGSGPLNTGWLTCHNTTPVGEGWLSGITVSNPGSPTVTQDSTGPICSWASGTTQGTNTGPRRGPATFQMQHSPLLEIFGGPTNTTISRVYYGLGTQVVLTDTDTIIGTTDSGIYAGWRPGDTNIQIFHHNGDGTAMTVIDTGLAKTTTMWKCAFMMDSTGFVWKVATVNGSKVSGRVTAKIPAASTNMAISAQAQNTTTTSITNNIRYTKLVLRNM